VEAGTRPRQRPSSFYRPCTVGAGAKAGLLDGLKITRQHRAPPSLVLELAMLFFPFLDCFRGRWLCPSRIRRVCLPIGGRSVCVPLGLTINSTRASERVKGRPDVRTNTTLSQSGSATVNHPTLFSNWSALCRPNRLSRCGESSTGFVLSGTRMQASWHRP
jgi:hypothetical protein